MFGEQFYPTPEPLIKKALSKYFKESRVKSVGWQRYTEDGYDFSKMSILDPSAGSGAFLDFIKEKNDRNYDASLNAIEIDPNLQSILREKGYPVIGGDFLEYNENLFWDLIIMNPPFKYGAEHLLHAIELASTTTVICILNAETIRNPYTEKRKQLLELIEEHGTYEYLEEEFIDADRKTNVEIALIKLEIDKKNDHFDFNFENEKSPELNFDFDAEQNQVARIDLIQNLQIRYDIIMDLFQKKLKNDARYDFHFQSMFKDSNYYESVYNSYHLKSGAPQQKYNHLSNGLKLHMWRQVMDELDVKKYMSASVAKNFEIFVSQQSQMAFTKENVASFFQMIMNNRVKIWNDAVISTFEVLTRYSEENRMTVPTWKTNDHYKINRKIILPNWCEWDVSYMDDQAKRTRGAEFKLRYSRNHEYTDIDKVLAFLSGHTLLHFNTIDFALEEHFKKIGSVCTGQKFENSCESAYFKMKFYKAGTIHLTFKDKKLWDLFNMTACAGKGWLPGPEKTKWEEEKRKRRDANKTQEEVKVEPLQIQETNTLTLF